MLHTMENNRLKVVINSKGAELWSIIDKRDGKEHLWQGDKALWPRRAPTAFPHCGRLKGDKYIYDNQTYKSTIHGFVRDYEHIISECNDNSCTFVFQSNEETLKKYPWNFHFTTIFKLENNKISHAFKVKNLDDKEMYFGIGYHPGFMCPFDDSHTIDEYILKFEKEETPIEILCNESGLLSGEERLYFENKDTIPLHDKQFPESFILSNLKSEYVSIVEKGSGKSVRVGIKDFPYVVFWSTPEVVKFVCVEPWHGLPDAHDTDGQFIKKRGVKKLSPQSEFTCEMTIEIISPDE